MLIFRTIKLCIFTAQSYGWQLEEACVQGEETYSELQLYCSSE